MNSKTKILIFILISINFLFYACEKEEIKDYSHFEKKYYVTVANSSYCGNQSSGYSYDRIIRPLVENDILKILDFEFVVKSETQLNFYLNDSYNTSLKFSSDYSSFDIEYSYSDQQPSSQSYTMRGVTTLLNESVIPHAYTADINGNYLLNCTNKDVQGGIVISDSNYTALSNVSFENNGLKINDKGFSPGLFHSYTESYSNNPSMLEHENNVFYCKNDSLFLDYYKISGIPRDTTHNIYAGVKQL